MTRKPLLLSALALGISLSLTSIAPAVASLPVSVSGEPLPSLAPMLDNVLPTVVSVYVEGTQTQKQQIPEEFRFFFGPNMPNEREDTRPFQGLGSGVIIDAENGYIVTNNHVINNANKIRVQLNDGSEYEAKLIGKDELSDIALLQVQVKEAKNLKAIKIADSDALRVGDFAVAIGNPFGIGQTVTSGIISALARSGLSLQGVENFIQTDASINRGNSGGALVNLKGELIGINTAILAPSGGSVGIGFAIPSTMVESLVQQLIKGGTIQRGILGVSGRELTADMAKALKLDTQRGAFVGEVMPKSAAAQAGIKAGDVIISFDGKPIKSFAELRAKVTIAGAGKEVKLGILRDGKQQEVTTKLLSNEEATTDVGTLNQALQGAIVKDSEVNKNKVVIIDEIQANSPAARAGLKKGDIIQAINREPITSIKDLRKILDSKPPVLALNILREDGNLYLILQ